MTRSRLKYVQKKKKIHRLLFICGAKLGQMTRICPYGEHIRALQRSPPPPPPMVRSGSVPPPAIGYPYPLAQVACAVEYGMAKKWIQGAIKKPGALRKSLGVKAGEKIPAKTLNRAAKASGKVGQRARLAKTLKGVKK